MKLASHNSMSFLTPKTWWGKLFRFAARCQDKDIFTQFNLGVRWFDLRLAFDNQGFACFAHGLVQFHPGYKGSSYSPLCVLSKLNELAQSEKVYVRILNERDNADPSLFWKFCNMIQTYYKNIIFIGGQNKKDWVKWYDFKTTAPTAIDKYSSQNNDTKLGTGWHLDDLWPRIYAICFNKHWREKYADKDVFLIQDFIGKY